MKCNEAIQIIYTYLDGQLTVEKEKTFLAHLSKCASCKKELEQAQKIHALLSKTCCSVEPPVDFVDNVMSKIEERKVVSLSTKRLSWKNWFNSGRPVAKAASFVAVLLVTGSVLAFNNSNNSFINISALNPNDKSAEVNQDNYINNDNKKNVDIVNNTDNNGIINKNIITNTETNKETPINKVENNGQVQETNQEKYNINTKTEDIEDIKSVKQTKQNNKPNTDKPDERIIRNLNPNIIDDNENFNNIRLSGPIKMASNSPRVPSKSISLTNLVVEDGIVNSKPNWVNQNEFNFLSNKDRNDGKYSVWSKNINTGAKYLVSNDLANSGFNSDFSNKSTKGTKNYVLENNQLFVNNFEGNEKTAVTPKLNTDKFVADWSSDGKTLAININSSKSDESGLWIAQSDGTSWKLGASIGGGNVVKYSPDGKKIAFTDKQNKLYVLIPSSSTLYLIVPNGDQTGNISLDWSSKSNSILFDWTRKENNTKGIYIAKLP